MYIQWYDSIDIIYECWIVHENMIHWLLCYILYRSFCCICHTVSTFLSLAPRLYWGVPHYYYCCGMFLLKKTLEREPLEYRRITTRLCCQILNDFHLAELGPEFRKYIFCSVRFFFFNVDFLPIIISSRASCGHKYLPFSPPGACLRCLS